MDKPGEMLTISQIMEKLRMKRSDNEFQYNEGSFIDTNGKKYQPQDLLIIKTYRFEGDSNPDDMAILYIIEAPGKRIQYSLDAYGAYTNEGMEYANFIRNIPIEDRDEAAIFDL